MSRYLLLLILSLGMMGLLVQAMDQEGSEPKYYFSMLGAKRSIRFLPQLTSSDQLNQWAVALYSVISEQCTIHSIEFCNGDWLEMEKYHNEPNRNHGSIVFPEGVPWELTNEYEKTLIKEWIEANRERATTIEFQGVPLRNYNKDLSNKKK